MIVNGFIEPLGQRAADGIRRRDEPADRAADGRLGRVSRLARSDSPRCARRSSQRHVAVRASLVLAHPIFDSNRRSVHEPSHRLHARVSLTTHSTPFCSRATSPTGCATCARQAWKTFAGVAAAQPQRRRVDADRHPRCSAWTGSACRPSRPPAPRCPTALLTARRRAGRPGDGRSTAVRIGRGSIDKLARQGRAVRQPRRVGAEHGDLIEPHLFRAVDPRLRQVRRPARRLLVGRNAAVRAARRGDRRPLHMLSALSAGRRRSGPHAGRSGRRGRGHAAGRNRQPATTTRRACTAARSRCSSAPAPGCAT